MSNFLNINQSPVLDDSIVSMHLHSYNPYMTSFNNSDEIRISIQQQDIYTLPHESLIYIEGTYSKNSKFKDGANGSTLPRLINNSAAFLFDEIRYELNGFEIDKCKNVGLTTTMKGVVSFTTSDLYSIKNSGWTLEDLDDGTIKIGSFSYCLPLKQFLGFAEDYKTIIMNAKQELILIRSRRNTNIFCGNEEVVDIKIDKIQWKIPHVKVSDSVKLSLLKYVERSQPINLFFRSWDLYEYPTLPQNDRNIWAVKTTNQVNKPRYIIIGFQTKRNNVINADASHFDHCNLTDVKVFLNSECYPYENLALNFTENKYGLLYDMYSKFQKSYYHNRISSHPLFDMADFKKFAPLVVIDCSRQDESFKTAVIDIRIEIQSSANIPAGTAAYCLIIHDNLITYNPYTNIVNRAV